MAGEAFFSGIETGLISIHRLRLQHFVRQGSRRALLLQEFLDNPDRLLGTTLAGTNLCMVITSIVSAGLAFDYWGSGGEMLSSAVVTMAVLIFSEYVPKAWFHGKPFERCMFFAPVLGWAARALRTPSAAIIWLSRLLVSGPTRSFTKGSPFLTRDELKLLARQGETDGVLSPAERAMIYRVLELSSKRAADIMVPRERMTFVEQNSSIDAFLKLARGVRFTRFPVYDSAQRRFVGIANVFAVAAAAVQARGKTVGEFARPPLLVPAHTPADDILPKLRRSRQPMCLIVDERSEVIGLLTVEDILREIVGQL